MKLIKAIFGHFNSNQHGRRGTQMQGFVIRAIGALAALLVVSGVQGATVFSQSPDITTGTRSDAEGVSRSADDFNLGGADTILSVTWRGMYWNNGTPQLVDDFTLNFYNDASGSVGSLISSFNVGNAVNRTDTGLDFLSVDFFEYTADLGAGQALGAATYWLSIFNDTTVDSDDSWFWAVESQTGNAQLSNDSGATWGPTGHTTYFVLDNSASVPIPAALWLFGSGLGMLGWITRRQTA
jgi:hypothetical protein